MNCDGLPSHALLLLRKQIKQLQSILATIENKKADHVKKQKKLCSERYSIELNINAMITIPPARRQNEIDEFTTLMRHNWKVKQALLRLETSINRIQRQDKRVRKAIEKAQALFADLAKERKSAPFSSSIQGRVELLVLKNQLLLEQFYSPQ